MKRSAAESRIGIAIRGFATYRERLRAFSRLEVEPGSKVRDLIRLLGLEEDHERAAVHIMVNGVHCMHLPEQWDTELQEGDEVAVFPPMAGG